MQADLDALALESLHRLLHRSGDVTENLIADALSPIVNDFEDLRDELERRMDGKDCRVFGGRIWKPEEDGAE